MLPCHLFGSLRREDCERRFERSGLLVIRPETGKHGVRAAFGRSFHIAVRRNICHRRMRDLRFVVIGIKSQIAVPALTAASAPVLFFRFDVAVSVFDGTGAVGAGAAAVLCAARRAFRHIAPFLSLFIRFRNQNLQFLIMLTSSRHRIDSILRI